MNPRPKPSPAQRIVIEPSKSLTRPWPAMPSPGETMEQFEARNGKVERLPAPWEQRP